jgi:uncharacterized protein
MFHHLHIILMINCMDPLFVDTWGWISLANRREKRHHFVVQVLNEYEQYSGLVFTSYAVLDETVSLLFRHLPKTVALETMDMIVRFCGLTIVPIASEVFSRTLDLRRQYSDKPEISFTDLSSFVVMSEHSIQKVLTEDKHFEFVHFGFERVY